MSIVVQPREAERAILARPIGVVTPAGEVLRPVFLPVGAARVTGGDGVPSPKKNRQDSGEGAVCFGPP